ncbi:Succinate dehydrogenase assembly factor 3 mitochondrial [Taenia crassiceps]|uniref:Succinate dehydrogenase assembly factor 3 n=1 Tax=Taenia crassiceps TaxID=6207 RepID=A0ABR4QKX9_9CEST
MILRTHKALPPELRELGDRYVREEFKKHKNCDSSYVGPFMMEWTRSFTAWVNRTPQKVNPHSDYLFSYRAATPNCIFNSDVFHFTHLLVSLHLCFLYILYSLLVS